MKIRPRPKTKLPTLVEIVCDMYPDLPFCDMSCKPSTIGEKVVHRPAFSNDLLITPSRGWQKVADGDGIKWHTLKIQIHLFFNRSGDSIQDVP